MPPSMYRWAGRAHHTEQGRRHPSVIREVSPAYESEGSELRALGTVQVGGDAGWTAILTVPSPARNVAFVELERRGARPDGYRGSEEAAHLSLPVAELDALVTLLVGVVDQARLDGLLPPRRDHSDR
jgi:hypothetical protein